MALNMKLDTDTQSFSRSLSDCPSLASSFCTSAGSSSPIAMETHRRGSVSWSDPNPSPEIMSATSRTISPSTPIRGHDSFDNVLSHPLTSVCMSSESLEAPSVFEYHTDLGESLDQQWSLSSLPKTCNDWDFNAYQHELFDQGHGRNNYLHDQFEYVSHPGSNPCLSRSIFQDGNLPVEIASQDTFMPWMSVTNSTTPQTVAPSATFRPMISSSPPCNQYPTTPTSLKYQSPITPLMDSSPFQTPSTSSSAQSRAYAVARLERKIEMSPTPEARVRKLSQRSLKRVPSKKVAGTKTAGAKPNAGSTPFVIHKNTFECPDCTNKEGKRRKFKRSEHLKRHRNTCHGDNRPHVCWVPKCNGRAFSRNDNLKAHLTNTHGKWSARMRNQYVATLDPSCDLYDPEWRGKLTSDGYPINHQASRGLQCDIDS